LTEPSQPPLPDPLPRGEREEVAHDLQNSSPLAGEEGARPRQRVGRRGGQRSLLDLAKRGRKKSTDAERKLWSILRSHRLQGWKLKRQEQLGDYIVDFVCFRARLIVEADGSQHAENEADVERTAWLEGERFRVIRFWNNDILLNPDGVATAILAALDDPSPTPPRQQAAKASYTLPQGERMAARISSPLAGEEGARPRQRVGRRGGN
jgi:very-short-patch-repair endonuclease